MNCAWEYKSVAFEIDPTFEASVDRRALEQKLNALGHEGWELVSLLAASDSDGETSGLLAVLKREA
ncbi:MAG: DUF4177 domain-containing protein [Planctomycetes bacterium]|nr:DUF4177 domain-containing protein [Planctomycetota bacterium]